MSLPGADKLTFVVCKFRHIAAFGQFNMHWIVWEQGVVMLNAAAQFGGFNPDNGISLGVKVLWAIKYGSGAMLSG